jgi:hypothetical protein
VFVATNHPKRPAKNAEGDEYAAFSDALKKVLSVSHSELKSHIEREKPKTQSKRVSSHVTGGKR